MQLPNTQALNSKSFKSVHAVLARGDAALPDVYKWIAQNSPEHPLFVYYDDATESLQYILWRDVDKGFNRAAHYLTRFHNGWPGDRPVIAILASSDNVTFYTTVIGAIRAGYIPFLVSPRNGVDAVAHLLRATKTVALFISAETAIQTLAEKALSLLKQYHDDPIIIQQHPMPIFDDLYPSQLQDGFNLEKLPEQKYDMASVAMILHSSGTTAFPKPIPWTHHHLLQFPLAAYYGERDLADLVMGCHGPPIYHAMGPMLFSLSAITGATISAYKPRFPAIAPTPDNLLDVALKTKSDIIFTVPSIIEEWSREPGKVEILKQFKGISFGGGPLSKSVGDYLADEGISVHPAYGLTETGPMTLVTPNTTGKDWDYTRLNPQANLVLLPREEGKFELVAYADKNFTPAVTNTEYNGYKAYATGDLLIPHPTKEGYWKILGRTDEQLMLSTGEKTNPIPLEKILLQNSYIQGAIMFGRGRPYNGVLVEPKEDHRFDPSDHTKLATFRNLLWPTVERMNDYAPQHSRLFKEMILVASPNKPFSWTAKGTPRRGAIISEYEAEIDACYEEVERSATVDTPELKNLDLDSVQNFIRQVVVGVMNKQIADDVDIFQSGCDSLQATWIRNKLLLVIKARDLQASRRLSPNFVYQVPTISGITQLTMNTLIPSGETRGSDEARTRELYDTVKRFTTSFPTRPENLRPRTSSGDIILLTGTTGGLGANALAAFTKDPGVSKIYGFNRPSANAVQRQVDAFSKHGLLADCLRSPKYQLVEGDLSKPLFGLDEGTFKQIHDSVTHIIHNAWPVDFNLSLVSFEKHLQGTRNLVDFALSSPFVDPPRLIFISSIGIFRQPKSSDIAPEESVNDASVPLGQGYGESKWVCEHILNEATKQTGLPTVVVRAGQLSSNRVGYWNEREWFPSVVKSAISVGCLPDVSGNGAVSWLPLYDAGIAVAEMRHSEYPILHLVNPRLVPWRMYLEPIAEELGVPLVPWNVWLSKLDDDLRDGSLTEVEHLQRNPALHLLEMFKHANLSDDFEPPGIARLETTKAIQVAPTLLSAEFDKEVGKQWVSAWRASGFLPPATN